ncbi:hypothetical protein Cgig2_015354 [Carnegiea gigantea]|uniref:Uncharacterized protein n=1 Tax=Carnegiea gigantea TaxID=171969 RepID=A0A9Q1K7H3_9CARY|nr:hypothetical protein Cgig2_015354 [Carnegiea gigantea]
MHITIIQAVYCSFFKFLNFFPVTGSIKTISSMGPTGLGIGRIRGGQSTIMDETLGNERTLLQNGQECEVGISLHDVEQIEVVELLQIHAELCESHKVKHIYYDLWLDHFYREYLVYFAYREQTDCEKEKFTAKKRSPTCITRQERMANLNVTKEGELIAFLAFSLCPFVLPDAKEVIRPKTFAMAALMASGQ